MDFVEFALSLLYRSSVVTSAGILLISKNFLSVDTFKSMSELILASYGPIVSSADSFSSKLEFDGKRKEKYVSPEAVEKLRIDLKKRKELEGLFKEIQLSEKTPSYSPYPSYEFHSAVTISNALSAFTAPVTPHKILPYF